MPANPTKVGYTFKEWNTKADGTGAKFLSTTHVIDDITVYAVYTKDSNPEEPQDPRDPQDPQVPRDPNNNSESGSIHDVDSSNSGQTNNSANSNKSGAEKLKSARKNTLPSTGVDNSPAIAITIAIAITGLTILLLSLLQKANNNL